MLHFPKTKNIDLFACFLHFQFYDNKVMAIIKKYSYGSTNISFTN